MKAGRLTGVWVVLVGLCLASSPAEAVQGTGLTMAEEQRAAHLFEQLKCPVCKNQSLASSTSYVAEQMKGQIREQIREGKTNEEVIAYYVDRYGEWILMRPPAEGRGLLVWLLPGVVLLIAGGFLVLTLRRWAGEPEREVAVTGDSTAVNSEERAAIRRLVEEES